MTEVPTTEWMQDFEEATRCLKRRDFLWPAYQTEGEDSFGAEQPGVVRHVFTHFPLELAVYMAELPAETARAGGTRWVPLAELSGEALPNVMRKVVAHAIPGY